MPGDYIRKTERKFEREHPSDPANAPGWDKHVDEFFNSEAFPGDGVRKATDAMRDPLPNVQPDPRGGSEQGTGADRRSNPNDSTPSGKSAVRNENPANGKPL